jgi:hypothetical protein
MEFAFLTFGPYEVVNSKHLAALCKDPKHSKNSMTTREKREHMRLKRIFRAKLARDASRHTVEGNTENVSQTGAFIKTKDWHSFKPNDKTTVTVYLPPIFSGQDETIGLQGSAIITRVDEENEGVAVQFLQNFKQFERIEDMKIPGKIRYKNLAYYLSSFATLPTSKFSQMYPGLEHISNGHALLLSLQHFRVIK